MLPAKHTWEQLLAEDPRGYCVLLDVDGVVMADGETEVPDEIRAHVAALAKHNDVWITSNTWRVSRRRQAAAELNVHYAHTHARKPSSRVLRAVENPRDLPYLVIGDKILTDALFAKSIGARLILMERRTSANDRFVITLVHLFEDFLYWMLKRR